MLGEHRRLTVCDVGARCAVNRSYPMERSTSNAYEDEQRAHSYAGLEFPGTYYLAYRDLPNLIQRHIRGSVALDFGCGAGRSTRFLKELGFEVLGVDISKPMLERAKERDPDGEYVLIPDGDLSVLNGRRFNLVFCSFTFDNVPTYENRLSLFANLAAALSDEGRMVNLVSAAEIYVHEWTSFSTKDFPENRHAKTGDAVRIVMLDVPDRRPIQDVFWTDADYRSLFGDAGLHLIETHRPLGKSTDPQAWVSECDVSPWAIHVLERTSDSS